MISTHVLDLSLGRPAAGVAIVLERQTAPAAWTIVERSATDADGRVREMAAGAALPRGTYRITFETGAYHRRMNVEPFYPRVVVFFEVREPADHHHVPLLLSPYGYSTYRGS